MPKFDKFLLDQKNRATGTSIRDVKPAFLQNASDSLPVFSASTDFFLYVSSSRAPFDFEHIPGK
jgi:hypothetical protein